MTLHPAPPPNPAVTGLAAVCVDCTDPPALAEFYARLLGSAWTVDADGDASVSGDGGPDIDCLRVPEGRRGKNRVHLDLRAADLEAAVASALALGASLAPDVYDGDAWVVLRDPEGNEFCFLRPRPDAPLHAVP